MSTSPLFTQAVDWRGWAATAEPRTCEACQTVFAPNHPRRRFCGGAECPGRRPAPARKPRKGPTGREQATARAAAIQGFLGDVVVAAQSAEGSPRAIAAAAKRVVTLEAAGAPPPARRQAIVALCAAAAVRAIRLVPPQS